MYNISIWKYWYNQFDVKLLVDSKWFLLDLDKGRKLGRAIVFKF